MFLLLGPVPPGDLDLFGETRPILQLRLLGFLDGQIRGVHRQESRLMIRLLFERVTPLAPPEGRDEIPLRLIEIQMRRFVLGEGLSEALDGFPVLLIQVEAAGLNGSHLESPPGYGCGNKIAYLTT